jgi:Ca2+-binding RTX toxin-like protein
LKQGAAVVGSDTTETAGGYGIEFLTPNTTYTVEFSGGGLPALVSATVTAVFESVKVDLVDTSKILSSVTTTIGAGATDLVLLGFVAINGTGNSSNNVLTGNRGNNTLDGAAGDDRLVYTGGFDTLNGSVGRDTADFSSLASSAWVDLNYAGTEAWTSGTSSYQGANTQIADLSGVECMIGTVNSDAFWGNSDANTYGFVANTAGLVDYYNGRAGIDTIDFSRLSSVWLDLNWAGGTEAYTSGTDLSRGYNANTAILSIDNVENIIGTPGSDTILGDGVGNTFSFTGTLAGDIDAYFGRGGSDTIDLSRHTAGVWVDLDYVGTQAWTSGTNAAYSYNSNTQLASVQSVENVTGTAFTDTILGSSADNTYLFTGTTAGLIDTFDGRGGIDVIDFSLYASAVWVSLGYAGVEAWTSGTSVANGANANTQVADIVGVEGVTGSGFSDTLIGDAGSNRIAGSRGTDTLTGGGGTDTFVFKEASDSDLFGYDTITDFVGGIGLDRIDLSQIDADPSDVADDAFTWLGNGPFGGIAGSLRYATDAGGAWVYGYTDTDNSADLVIRLNNVTAMFSNNFDL